MRLAIATPVYGGNNAAMVAYGYHRAVRALEAQGAVAVSGDIASSEDIVKARMRLLWAALHHVPNWDWLLWWDADVIPPDLSIVPRMVEAADARGWKMIGAPYPRKSIRARFPYRPNAESMAAATCDPDGAIRVPMHLDGNLCTTVQAIGMGFTLTHREMLELMISHFSEQLWCVESVAGKSEEMVSLFSMVMGPTTWAMRGDQKIRFREQLGEDYSFCFRWRSIGGEIGMYCGHGTPLAHVGSHTFMADGADLGLV